MILVGQASCLSFRNRQDACPTRNKVSLAPTRVKTFPTLCIIMGCGDRAKALDFYNETTALFV